MGKVKDLLNAVKLEPGMILQSRIHGGYIVVIEPKRFRLGIPTEYACLSKDNGLITDYTIGRIDDSFLTTEYYDKTVTLLYGKK